MIYFCYKFILSYITEIKVFFSYVNYLLKDNNKYSERKSVLHDDALAPLCDVINIHFQQ